MSEVAEAVAAEPVVAVAPPPAAPAPSKSTAIPGDRGRARVSRAISLQGRMQNALAMGVVTLLGGAFLFWYYSRVAVERPPPDAAKATAAVQAEMTLPPLGPATARDVTPEEEKSALLDLESAEAQALLAADPSGLAAIEGPPAGGPLPPDPVQQRILGSPVLIRGSGAFVPERDGAVEETGADAALDGPSVAAGRPGLGLAGGSETAGSALPGMLRPTRAAAVAAGVLPDRRFLLTKGAFIDCTLETAIDSTLPGMTTCITATDVWSADGSVVLLERGTKLVGETRGSVRQGQRRLFVLWSEARTPAGVVVELASPGTDALGRSGVTGEVDTHFGARFGAAILISLINAGTAALVASQTSGDGGSVVIAPQGATDVVSEVIRQTANVPPTIRVAQGERLQVLVARDVDFAGVYRLTRR